jgi:peptide methionine sulfoxide reductase MsrA
VTRIVTEIKLAGEFYPAEEYHQEYYKKKGIAPACSINNVNGRTFISSIHFCF